MTTPQHLLIEIPAPYTKMKVGLNAVSASHDGFSVVTDGHVWLTALAKSTFSAHSQGPLRIVSEEGNTYVAAKVGVTAATTGGATIAATGGVKIIAGYDAQPSMQQPDVGITSPPAADDVSAGCDSVATAWTIADTTVAGLLTAKAAGLMILGNKGNTVREMLTTSNAIGAMGLASGIAGMATNVAGMAGASAPGINVHAKGGINIATPAFCSIYGMAGLLMCSPFNTQIFGAATVGIAGLAGAGMSSLGKVDLASHKGISAIGGSECAVKSTFGEVILKGGKGLSIGQVLPDSGNTAQLVTLKSSFSATAGMRVHSGSGEVRLGRVSEDIVVETATQGALEAVFAAVASATSSVLGAGLGGVVPNALRSVQPPATDPVITLDEKVTIGTEGSFVATESITLAVGPWIVTIDKDGVTLGMGVTTPPTAADANLQPPTIEGPQVKLEAAELTAAMMPAGGSMKMSSDSIELTSTLGAGKITVGSDAVELTDFAMVTFA